MHGAWDCRNPASAPPLKNCFTYAHPDGAGNLRRNRATRSAFSFSVNPSGLISPDRSPELKTSSEAISWFQLAIATGLIWRRTLPLSGLGIAALFAVGVRDGKKPRPLTLSQAVPFVSGTYTDEGAYS
jgi:hypothetical protein